MTIKYMKEIPMKDKRVLIRVDYNVPYDSDMKITDDTRIRETVPTLEYCLKEGASIILVSHLGRPKGKPNPSMSLKPVKERLSQLIKKEIKFIEDPVEKVKPIADSMKNGDIMMLENIRFYPGEEKNDDILGQQLAALCDIYIDDAFAAAHRGHSSNDAITKHVKTVAAGFLLEKEIEYFKKSMTNPERPLGAVVGGAKVSTKIDALKNIITKVDFLIIGGGMVFTFLKAKGMEVGKSLLEKDFVETAAAIMKEAEAKKVQILLPTDIVVASEFKNESPKKTVSASSIPADMLGLDIGPESIKLFAEKIKSAKTVIWNGPMGAFEMSNFADGTNSIAKTLAESSCLSIVGGGDSVTAVNQSGVADKISYISTGGGAFLELLEGKTLPAIAALDR